MLTSVLQSDVLMFSVAQHVTSALIHNCRGKIRNIRFNILCWLFQSTTVQRTSSSAPVVTSASTPTTDATASLTAATARTSATAVSVSAHCSRSVATKRVAELFFNALTSRRLHPSHQAARHVPPRERVPVPVGWQLHPIQLGVR